MLISNIPPFLKKKLGRWGKDHPHAISLRAQPEPSRKKPRKLVPSYMGMPPPMVWALTRALMLNPHDQPHIPPGAFTIGQFTHADQGSQLVTFHNLGLKFTPMGRRTHPGPKECYSDHLTDSARGPFAQCFFSHPLQITTHLFTPLSHK